MDVVPESSFTEDELGSFFVDAFNRHKAGELEPVSPVPELSGEALAWRAHAKQFARAENAEAALRQQLDPEIAAQVNQQTAIQFAAMWLTLPRCQGGPAKEGQAAVVRYLLEHDCRCGAWELSLGCNLDHEDPPDALGKMFRRIRANVRKTECKFTIRENGGDFVLVLDDEMRP